ncbi:MAG TPA: DUF2934 domain-containing protein [Bryobacteraceae bacterium]|nr:DUF2934 domain-containing protein [Bryobacteraceae bacterium]
MQVDGKLPAAYRATFREYSKQLDGLHSLLQGNPAPDRIESVRLLVEKARVAHNAARDRLARELVRPPLPAHAKVDDSHIRQTAQLLWEVAGRPEGSAERDWKRAEQLVRTSGA